MLHISTYFASTIIHMTYIISIYFNDRITPYLMYYRRTICYSLLTLKSIHIHVEENPLIRY